MDNRDSWQLLSDNQLPDWLVTAKVQIRKLPPKAIEVRERALDDLNYFAVLMNEGYMYGEIHRELFRWMQEYALFGQGGSLSSNKLIMLPRAHLKSHMVATWCAWLALRHPEVTILYLSATAELAETQLFAIKNIMESTTFQRFFPEYIHPQKGLRTAWNNNEVIVDHPFRASQGVRDATFKTAGLTTNTTGWHADVIVSDDIVVPENAYTEDGRAAVSKKASQFTSIRNPGGFSMACGTRYHPNDIYAVWKEQIYPIYDSEGEQIDVSPVWEVKEFAVESDSLYIWPRVVRPDGKAFGFNIQVLSRIKAEYSDTVQFYAQYYNDPNDPSSDRISRDKFQYYNPRFLKKEGSRWFYNGSRLNIYAAVDFAFSLKRAADFSAIVVVGVDADGNYYVLDIDRFKTDKTLEYFKHVAELHSKWKFNKLQAEVTTAQKVIVEAIKDYIKQQGMSLAVVEFRPGKAEGSKEERIAAALEHLYDNQKVWHCEGGWTPTLEEELVQSRPAHDDCKDALASAVSIATKPQKSSGSMIKEMFMTTTKSRFGGVSYR